MATSGVGATSAARRTSATVPPSGFESPAPNTASTTSAASAGRARASGSTGPSQAAAAFAASPFKASRSPSSATPTSKPAAFSAAATTNPSPPLLPGPQRTSVLRGVQRCWIAVATASPARCISTKPGVPASIAALSAAVISATVRISVGGMGV